MAWAVEASSVSKQYRSMQTRAINRISFNVDAGEIVGVLGPNGAGKSTLLKMICGVVAPTDGVLKVLGYDVVKSSNDVKRRIGVAHQRLTLEMMLTGYDNLQIGAAFQGIRWREAWPRVQDLLATFQLSQEKLRVPVFTLSGGQMRRLVVIRALLGSAQLLLLDEPSAGLDVAARRRIWSHLHKLREQRNVTIVWTSHYVEELEQNCDRVLIVDGGKLVRFASPTELVAELSEPRVVVGCEQEVPDSVTRDLAAGYGLRASVDGRRIEVWTENGEKFLPELLAALAARSLEPCDIRFHPASLEDAYLELVERSRLIERRAEVE